MIIGGIGAFVKELPKGKTRILDADTSTDIFVSQAELHKYLPNFNMETLNNGLSFSFLLVSLIYLAIVFMILIFIPFLTIFVYFLPVLVALPG